MKKLIENIEEELKAARDRSSTNNMYDYPYANGLKYALDQIKLYGKMKQTKFISLALPSSEGYDNFYRYLDRLREYFEQIGYKKAYFVLTITKSELKRMKIIDKLDKIDAWMFNYHTRYGINWYIVTY